MDQLRRPNMPLPHASLAPSKRNIKHVGIDPLALVSLVSYHHKRAQQSSPRVIDLKGWKNRTLAPPVRSYSLSMSGLRRPASPTVYSSLERFRRNGVCISEFLIHLSSHDETHSFLVDSRAKNSLLDPIKFRLSCTTIRKEEWYLQAPRALQMRLLRNRKKRAGWRFNGKHNHVSFSPSTFSQNHKLPGSNYAFVRRISNLTWKTLTSVLCLQERP